MMDTWAAIMKTLKAGWTIHTTTVYDAAYDVSQLPEFIKYLVEEFAKLDIHGAFSLPYGYEGGKVIFTDSKQQFLYELRGGFALYRRLREQYFQLQEQLIAQAMADEIAKEIDREILEQLKREAEVEELARSIKRIDL